MDALSIADREESWARILAAGSSTVVAEVEGVVWGFASSGPASDQDASPETGQVYALYVDPEWQGHGIGQMLFVHAHEALSSERFVEATLWVLEENAPSRGFYEAAAMEADGGRKALEFAGEETVEVRYRRRLAPIPGPRTSAQTSLVVVVDYDEAWPALFEREQAAIGEAAPGLVVEHVGSTSVPGFAAKPIIDLQAGARTFDEACEAVVPLREIGWEYVGEAGIPGRLYFRKQEGGHCTHNLHLVVEGGRGWRQTIRFRDYLRAHPDAAAEYGRLKRDLAASDPKDVAAYTHRKSPFIRATLALAEAEDAR